MKVLLIDVNCKSSSTGQIVYNLYHFLNSNGDIASVCYGRGELVNESNIYKFSLDWETKLHAFLTRLTGYTGCFSHFSTRRLLRYIDAFQPDIVHIHELHAYFLNDVQLLEYLGNRHIPVVHTIHSEFSYTGKCGHADDCVKWKTECRNCPKVSHYPKSLFFDQTSKMYYKKKHAFESIGRLIITTPSEWLTNRAHESFFKHNCIITIHNGVDTEIFRQINSNRIRRMYGISNRQRLLISIAPNIMSHGKGGRYILECAKIMNRENYFFLLIGADKTEKTHQENVLILPRITDKRQLAEYYNAADIFLLCSKKETFSLTCAESLCCGTPVVGFRCGAPEMIFEEPYAYFVEQGDIIALIHQIERTINCNVGRTEIEEYAHNHFSINKMLEKYKSVYDTISQKQ